MTRDLGIAAEVFLDQYCGDTDRHGDWGTRPGAEQTLTALLDHERMEERARVRQLLASMANEGLVNAERLLAFDGMESESRAREIASIRLLEAAQVLGFDQMMEKINESFVRAQELTKETDAILARGKGARG